MRVVLLILSMVLTAYGCLETTTISGRAVRRADAGFVGVARVRITANVYAGMTNPFGYYRITVPNCGAYSITAAAKSYSFDSQVFTLPVADQDGINIDFVAK